MKARRWQEQTNPTADPAEQARSAPLIADTNEILREQLEFLIEHAGEQTCGCSSCLRYSSVRAVLMQVFAT